jgi:ABC-type transporter Mla subunit MlaD
MINLDKLGDIKLERISPALNRNQAQISQLIRKHNEHIRELKGTITTHVKTLKDFEQVIRADMSQENQP